MFYNNGMSKTAFEYTDVIDRVRYFRERKGMSQRTLSLDLGKSENYIGKAESYDFKLPVDILMRIIELLGLTPNEFFYQDVASYALDSKILEKFKAFTEEEKTVLSNIIDTLYKNHTA